MPNPFGFSFAYGDEEVRHAAAGSAFSQGDVVMFTASGSSLSRVDNIFPSGAEIAGVARSASTASYGYGQEDNNANLVAYTVWKPDAVFWASLATSMEGSTRTAGEEFDIRYFNGIMSVESSQNSTRVQIVDVSYIATDSARSYVLVRPVTSGGEGEF